MKSGETQSVLITGATSGIGAACARLFAKSGAAVMVAGRDRDRAWQVGDSIRASGGRAAEWCGDLHDRRVGDDLVVATVGAFGRLDIVVNSAGITHAGTATETSDDLWEDALDLNLSAAFRISRAAVAVMRRQGCGAIVNVASEWAVNGESGHVAYCVSKGGMIQMTRAMALEHARDGIRINAVCPGEVHTEMLEASLRRNGPDVAQSLAKLAAGLPMGRVAKPIEVAQCIAFWASDLASYVTGTTLLVDGECDATVGPFP